MHKTVQSIIEEVATNYTNDISDEGIVNVLKQYLDGDEMFKDISILTLLSEEDASLLEDGLDEAFANHEFDDVEGVEILPEDA